jgi:uncharacterized protein (DUF2164 family)
MRFLISPEAAVCWFLLSATTDRRNFRQYEEGGYTLMSVNIFETATKELRSTHDQNELRNLKQVSGDYYWAELDNNKLEELLAKILSAEEFESVNKLHENFTMKETIAGEIYYNQGFSDAIRLILQSLTWGPVRR